MSFLLSPSILSADFSNLSQVVNMLNESDADWIHLDIMDGVFVPNLSFGLPVVQAIHRHAKKPLDVHLMIVNPQHYIEAFQQVGASTITVHIETCPHLHRIIELIKRNGCRAGVAINPHTPVSQLSEIIDQVDLVCVMSVNPGFGGQSFIEKTFHKIHELRELITHERAHTLIEVDGGINESNALAVVKAGADVLVVGHCIFSSTSPKNTIAKLKRT